MLVLNILVLCRSRLVMLGQVTSG